MDTGSASAPAVVQPADAPKPHPSKMPSAVSPQAPASTMASPMKVAQSIFDKHRDAITYALGGAALGGAMGAGIGYIQPNQRAGDDGSAARELGLYGALGGAVIGGLLGHEYAEQGRRMDALLQQLREQARNVKVKQQVHFPVYGETEAAQRIKDVVDRMRQQNKQASVNPSFFNRNRSAITGALTGAAAGGLSGAAAGGFAERNDPKNNPNAIRNGAVMGLLSGAALGGLAGHGMGRQAKPTPSLSPPGASSSWYDTSRHPEKLRRVWDTVVSSSELKDPAAAQRAQDFLNQVGSPGMDIGAVERLRNSFPQDSHTRQLFNILMNHHVKTAAFSDTLRRFGFSI